METEPRTFATSDKDLQPGQKVGEYVIDAKIGEGGFGTVFKASHPLIGKLGAIKVLNRQYSADPEMVSRFVAEARAVNQIRHRNIIDIFGFGQLEDGRSYYVMEFLEGEPLDEFLAKGGAVPLGQAIPILRAVARALDAAHAKGIAHRDLKPENIFLARESDDTIFPKLLDFGIAKLLGSQSGVAMHKTRTGAPIGTPHYMSPEQCRGRDVDHRTDIYAFGVVAYKLLTGVVPFDGEDYMDILLKQIGEEAVPPSQRLASDGGATLPRAVDDAIAWMMKKDPAARPPNLITAMRALEDAALDAGVQFSTDSPTGLHATQTSRVAAQRTPSAITPLPRVSGVSASFGGAATIDATRLSEAVEARSAAITPSPVELHAPPRKSPLLWILALVGAIGIGAVVFFALRSHKQTDSAGDGQSSTSSTPPSKPVNQGSVGASGQGSTVASGTGSTAASSGSAATTGTGTGSAATTGSAAAGSAGAGAGTATASIGSGTASSTGNTTIHTAPTLVTITVEGPPKGTEVYGPRGLIGSAPGPIQLDRGDGAIVLTFKADGYVLGSKTVTPTADQNLDVTLEKQHVDTIAKTGKGKTDGKSKGKGNGSGSGSGTGRDTLEDPFGAGGSGSGGH